MPTKHTARTAMTVEVPFDCAKCHYTGTALVDAEGKATRPSFVGFDREAALENARKAAVENAHRHGEITASLYPCPRCGHASKVAHALFIAGTTVSAAALVAGGVLLVMLIGVFGVGPAVISVVAAGALVRKRRQHYFLTRALVHRVLPRAELPTAIALAAPPRRSPPPRVETAEPAPDGKPRMLV